MNSLLRGVIFCVAGIIFATHGWGIEFSPKSQLAEGRWVKIKTTETGLYAIPYLDLIEMGFPVPENVGVYGKGGEMLSMNFDDEETGLHYYDDISPVSVIHDNGRLIFYAEGVDKVIWNSGENCFKRKSKNIYSDYGIYFLSDKNGPLPAEMIKESLEGELLDMGMDFIFHEKDICHNVTGTGQQYWGEEFKDTDGLMKWCVPAPLATDGTARLEYEFYIEPSSSGQVHYTTEMGIEESADKFTSSSSIRKTEEFLSQNFSNLFKVAPKGEFNIRLGVNADESDFSKIDYWLLTYPKQLPVTGEELTVPQRYMLSFNGKGSYALTLGDNVSLLDITDPKRIRKASVSTDRGSRNRMFAGSTSDYSDIILYSTNSEFKTISSWKKLDNANLHGLDCDKAELVILTVPQFREYAMQIADLHRRYDEVESIVVTPEELYNEFSGGVPDPMAYRAFLRMLYERGEGRLKNLLLLGPSQADMRVMKGDGDLDCIIAFQEPKATTERDAASVYDFYGMLALYVNPERLYRETMDIGVGLLSCNDERACRRAVRKIRRYLEDSGSRAWMLNDALL